MYITILAEYMHSAPLVNFFFYAKESQIIPYKALGRMFTFAACSYLPEARTLQKECNCASTALFTFFFSQTLLEQAGWQATSQVLDF